ncbi:conserved hypothetical protein [Bradyrhizobium sp. ORS 375]|uniref:hypothetical protein n=1 Tax=Bradyrhizobium sp. (strain ORS 375) TaxID=566679 RepID=UPI000240A74D|nr:hypothetical protein [Bradyrhizobium sp. ORS 375]CCD92890.1 conserved hypothetical protein [Bradyrhizobium sp. ORS 375]
MANERLPNERYPDGMNRPDMSTRPGMSGAGMTGAGLTEPGMTGTEYERAARMDSRLQPDPELTEGRASGGRIAAYAVGIAILLGAVFYGLNNMSMHDNQASTTPTSQTASKQPAPNSSPGVTTGAAGDRTTPPPAPAGQTNNNAK